MKKNYLGVAIRAALIAPLATSAIVSNAVAQQNGSDAASNVEVIAVSGIRGSLQQSLSIKRASSQVVDAISSEDVGKFPDANVAESLQRITGVAIDRNGGEGQFITVRGLGPEFNTVLLNGRTLATDNDGREFSFDVLSSDIIQRAEVFKSAVPDLQSGGIGATVNIVTARPLQNGQNSINFSASGIYEDQRAGVTPEFSVISNWVNDEGTYGFSAGISYSDRATQLDTVNTNGFADRSGDPAVLAPESSSGLTEVGVLPDGARVQQQVVISRDTQDRERITFNGAFQAKPNEKMEITVDALYSQFDIESFATQFSGFFSPPFLDPQIDENGTVVAFNRPGQTFLDRNPAIAGQIGLSQNDNVLTSNNREAESYLIGANFKYNVNDYFSFNVDVSTSNATRDQTNPFVVLGALAPESPLIALPDNAEISTLTNIVGAQDTSIQRLHFVNVNRQAVEDDINEIKASGEYIFDTGSLTKVTFGAMYSDRSKERQLFDNFSPTQGAGIFCAFCGYTVDFDDAILGQVNLDDFLSGVSGADRIPVNFLAASFENAFAQLNSNAAITAPDRSGRGDLSDAELIRRRNAAGDSIFGFYEPELNPAGSFRVDEEVTSFFINTFWEGGDTITWSANVGFRIDATDTTSFGVDQPVIEFRETVGDTQLVPVLGPSTEVAIDNSYINILPSANIKFDLSDDVILRAAFSETVTRPTLTSLGVNNVFGGRSNAPTSGGGNPMLEAFESRNYDLALEWYVDEISFVGASLFFKEFENFLEAATLPVPGEVIIPAGNVGNPGDEDIAVDVTFQDTRTRNGETGSIVGLEVALQKGWENGLGAALNYTYVESFIDRSLESGASDCDYNGLSPNTVNLSGFFENDRWSARLSYNYRDEFLVQCFSDFSEPRQREAFGQVDFTASYNISESFQVFFEGINVTDEERRDFSRFENRFLTYEDTGPRYTLGFRGSF